MQKLTIKIIKKIGISFLLTIFVSQQILAQFSFLQTPKISEKETVPTKIDIVAVVVDQEIYPAIKSDIQRYATDYIQGKNNTHNPINSSKALVLPINTKEIQAPEIVKILENLYFNGEKDIPSRLKGVVLVGDVPLPVVKDRSFVFPTIYPYVDFEQQKFVWDTDQRYFIPQSDSNNQAEIFHGIIKYKTANEYKKYFKKLKEYTQDPKKYIGKNFWYEDLIANKKTFLSEVQEKYINNWLFAEDVAYHRYSKLLLDVLQNMNDASISETIKGLPQVNIGDVSTKTSSKGVPTLMLSRIIKEGHFKSYYNLWSKKFLSRIRDNLQWSNRRIESYSQKRKNKKTGEMVTINKKRNTWDSHFMKIEAKDQYFLGGLGGLNTLFVDINNSLEEEIDKKIDQEKYYMNEILPLTYLRYQMGQIKKRKWGRTKKRNIWNIYDLYTNYFFGTKAENLKNLEEISIYRGTYKNLKNLETATLKNTTEDLNKDLNIVDFSNKGVGASYDIFSQQISANRALNYFLAQDDINAYSGNKIVKEENRKRECAKTERIKILWFTVYKFCSSYHFVPKKTDNEDGKCDKDTSPKDCESITGFTQRERGGASFLNIEDPIKGERKTPFKYYNARKPIFNMGGAKATEKEKLTTDAIKRYTTMIQEKYGNELGRGYKGNFENIVDDYGKGYTILGITGNDIKFTNRKYNVKKGKREDNPPKKYDLVDYFSVIKNPTLEFSIEKTKGNFNILKVRKEKGISESTNNQEEEKDETLFETLIKDGFKDRLAKDSGDASFSQIKEGFLEEAGKVLSEEEIGELKEITNQNKFWDNLTLRIKRIEFYGISTGEKLVEMQSISGYKFLEKKSFLLTGTKDILTGGQIKTLSQIGKENNFYVNFHSTIKDTIPKTTLLKYQKNLLSNNKSGSKSYSKFRDGELRTYKTIDSRVYHKNVFSGSIAQGLSGSMNLLTTSRPVDSPRYLSFKGIGGDEIKFIYPNIYKVEVFQKKEGDILLLKKPKEIEKSIRKYLLDTVKKYNIYLKEQRSKQKILYNNNKKAYQEIGRLDTLASPISPQRNYDLFPEDYLIKKIEEKIRKTSAFKGNIGGNSPLEFLSQMIYYQNINWQEKSSSNFIKDDIISTIKSFNINPKIKTTLQEYLKRGNDKGSFLTPLYKKDGYEVAYLNSDGDDFIRNEDMNPPFLEKIKNQVEKQKIKTKKKIETVELYKDLGLNLDSDTTDECSPSEGGELLFDITTGKSPWFSAFKCRFSKFKENVELEIIRPKGENGIKGVLKGYEEDLTDEVEKNQRKRSALNVDKKNEEVFSSLGVLDTKKLTTIHAYTQLNLKERSITADDPTTTILSLFSTKSLGVVDFKISTVGDDHVIAKKIIRDSGGNIKLGSPKLLGDENVELKFRADPQKKQEIQFSLENKKEERKEGYVVINVKMCISGTDICAQKIAKLNILPGKIAKSGFEKNKGKNIQEKQKTIKKVLAGATVPIKFYGEDVRGNNVGQLIDESYSFSVGKGLIGLQAAKYTGFNFQDFSQGFLRYQAPKIEKPIATEIKMLKNEKNGKKEEDKINLIILPGKLNFSFYDNKRDSLNKSKSIVLSLPNLEKQIYGNEGDIPQSLLKDLPKIEIKLTDKQGKKLDLTTKLQIKSPKSLLVPGNLETKNGKKKFASKQYFEIKDGKATIYFYPSFKSGEDQITVTIPGVLTHTFSVKLNPGDAVQTEIFSDKDRVKLGENIKFIIAVQDKRGNAIQDLSTVKLSSLGGLTILEKKEKEGKIEIITQTKEGSNGQGTLFSILKNIPFASQKPGYKTVVIEQSYLPTENLNVMYLNLFGADWGNLWGYFSDHKNFISEIMNNSERLLATTTQLVSSKKIKSIVAHLGKNSQIQTEEPVLTLSLKDNQLNYSIPKIVTFSYPISSSFSISKIATIEELEKFIKDDISKNTNNKNNKNSIYYLANDIDSIILENSIQNNKIVIKEKDHKEKIIIDFNKGNLPSEISFVRNNAYQGKNTLFNVFYKQLEIGKIIIQIPDISKWKTEISGNYLQELIWNGGSTNKKRTIAIIDPMVRYSPNKLYDSIEDSSNTKKGIGFSSDFKNITNFGLGLSVGEATIPFGSEFLVNFGDPLLSRVSNNEFLEIDNGIEKKESVEKLPYDGGVGKIIASFPDKNIQKIVPGDINNDGEKDFIILFSDSSIKIVKKYQGNNNYEDLGDLLYVSAGVEDLFVGDVDGNNYSDIIIKTKDKKLRVYKNNKGRFSIDGNSICLNINVEEGDISLSPQEIDVHQLFIKDMDYDTNLDIVTYDKYGYIKIFYGGEGDPFVSKNEYTCDDGWQNRQKDLTLVLKKYSLFLDSTDEITDSSLIRWKGLGKETKSSFENIDPKDLGMNPDLLKNIDPKMDPKDISKIVANATKFNTNKAIASFQKNKKQTLGNLLGFKPLYEINEKAYDYGYIRTRDIKDEDPIKVYKMYIPIEGESEIHPGEKVKVKITLEANKNQDFIGTFSDKIEGPWIIPTNKEGEIKNLQFSVQPNKYQGKEIKKYWDLENTSYVFDNIYIKAGERLERSYILEYLGGAPSVKIKIEELDGKGFEKINSETSKYTKDTLPDILISPMDACLQKQEIFFNSNNESQKNRKYDDLFLDIGEFLKKEGRKRKKELDEKTNKTYSNITKNIGKGSNIGNIGGKSIVTEKWSNLGFLVEGMTFDDIMKNGGLDVGGIINAPFQLIDGMLGDVSTKIDDLMNGLCNGFAGGGTMKGLPVPFNQAFLAPGNYHVFGCYDIPPLNKVLGKGIPTMSFPGNWGPIFGVYLPIPNFFGFPFRGPTDGHFGGPQSGTRPSQVRVYTAPTLTAQLGIAICFGPYDPAVQIPSPAADMGGNCIVTAVGLSGDDNDDSVKEKTKTGGEQGKNPSLDKYLTELKSCTKNIPQGKKTSPFKLKGGVSDIPLKDGQYLGGLINIEIQPQVGLFGSSSIGKTGKLFIKGGASQDNKITDGNSGGFIKKLIKSWMDRQTRYIINNLTKMNVNIVFPKFNKMFDGFDAIGENTLDYQKKRCINLKGHWNNENSKCIISSKQKCINKGMKGNYPHCSIAGNSNAKGFDLLKNSLENGGGWLKAQGNGLSSSNALGIAEKLESTFKNVPLVNIMSENISVNVPNVSKEDINAYVNEGKSWVERQKKIIKEREQFFISIFALCDENIHTRKDVENNIKTIKNKIQNEKKDEKQKSQERTSGPDFLLFNALTKKYDYSNLGKNINSLVNCENKTIFKITPYPIGTILPEDIYFKIENGEIKSLTKGKEIKKGKKVNGKTVLYSESNPNKEGEDICIKKQQSISKNMCSKVLGDVDIVSLVQEFISFKLNTTKLTDSVRKNISTLQKYKKLPAQLYELVHVQERYLSELSTLIKTFIGTLGLWMKTNSERISQYLDAITSIITTLETYQLLIDFSVERTEKCGTCTKDTYDQYSCKLGFLCPEIPIIPIPPFKIPDINVDLSHFNLGMDIKLPKFSFTSYPLPLPSIPDLPSPPEFAPNISINLNIDLFGNIPGIPLIPEPPEIPELPSFIPVVKMKLPLVPPAPKIPKLPNKITGIMKTAKKLAKIMCIVKQPIGMVAEYAVKAKIEQITQRQYVVPLFDNLDFTPKWIGDALNFVEGTEAKPTTETPLYGFDFDISSYVDIQFDFDEAYAIMKGIANEINSVSLSLNHNIEDLTNEISESAREGKEKMTYNGVKDLLSKKEEIDLKSEDNNIQSIDKKISKYKTLLGTYSKKLIAISKEKAKKESYLSNLIEDISEIKEKIYKNEYQIKNNNIDSYKTTLSLENTRLKQEKKIKEKEKEKLEQEVEKIKNEYNEFLKKYHIFEERYTELLEQYKNLTKEKSFVSMLSYEQVPYSKEILKETNENIKEGLEHLITTEDNGPNKEKAKQLLGLLTEEKKLYSKDLSPLQKVAEKIIIKEKGKLNKLASIIKDDYGFFAKNISNREQVISDTSVTLNTSLFSFRKMEEDEGIVRIDGGGKEYDEIDSEKGRGEGPIRNNNDSLLQNNKTDKEKTKGTPYGGDKSQDEIEGDNVMLDIAPYIKGIFIPTGNGKTVSVVKSQQYADLIQDNYLLEDLNNDGKKEVVLWNENTVYVKYAYPFLKAFNDKKSKNIYEKYYEYEINSLAKLKSIANKYVEVGDSEFQLYSSDFEVKNFATAGQSYEDITISWDNKNYQDHDIDGYLVKLNNRVDTFFEKKDKGNRETNEKYHQQYALIFPDTANYTGAVISLGGMKKTIAEYSTGVLITTGVYNVSDEKIELSLPQENEKERERKYLEITTLKKDEQENQYTINSSVSNQVVGGSEASSDTLGPEISGELYRPSTKETLSGFILVQGYLGTHYDLKIKLEDNVMLKSGKLFSKSGDLLVEKSFSNSVGYLELKDLFFEQETEKKYTIEAIDSNDNMTKQEIILQIKKPGLRLTTINDIESDSKDNTGVIIPAQIISVLDHDIDEGIVNFYRKRHRRDILVSNKTGVKLSDHMLKPLKRVIIGGMYSFSNNLGFYDNAGNKIAELNPYNGNIAILSSYKEKYYLETVYGKQVQTLKIRQKLDKKELFKIALPMEKLVSIDEGELIKYPILAKSLGKFLGGRALKKGKKVYLYVSPQGEIYTEYALEGRYEFDEQNQTVKYYFSFPEENISEGYVEVKIKNFLSALKPDSK